MEAYLIPAAIVLLVFIIGFANSRKAMSKYAVAASMNADSQTSKPKHSGVYEVSGVNQQSNHPLGAVQSVIRGRIRFLAFGVMLIGIALLGLYAIYYMPDRIQDFTGTDLNRLIATVIMAGGIVWGLQLISFITYRIKLRRTGFEISSIFGTKAYEYNDVDFYLDRTIEHKYESDGYRPVFMKTQTFNFIWVCQVLFRDGRKPIMLKSSRYAWLKNKMRGLLDALYIN
jgi:hypothetical protein